MAQMTISEMTRELDQLTNVLRIANAEMVDAITANDIHAYLPPCGVFYAALMRTRVLRQMVEQHRQRQEYTQAIAAMGRINAANKPVFEGIK